MVKRVYTNVGPYLKKKAEDAYLFMKFKVMKPFASKSFFQQMKSGKRRFFIAWPSFGENATIWKNGQ